MNQQLFIPKISLEIAEQTLESECANLLAEIQVWQKLSLPTLCELTFLESINWSIDNIPQLKLGSSLKISFPESGNILFSGQITAIDYSYEASGAKEVRVRAYDLLHQLRKSQPIRKHVKVDLVTLAKSILTPYNISVESSESSPLFPQLIQHQQSDLDFLSEVAQRCGLYFTLRGDTLHILSLEGLKNSLELILGDSLFQASIEVNGDISKRSISTLAWNPRSNESIRGEARNPKVGRDIPTKILPQEVGGADKQNLINQSVQNQPQAVALAQKELDFRIAQEITLWGIANGDSDLQPGTSIAVKGVAPSLEGKYVLTDVKHIINSDSGFISEISTTPPLPRHNLDNAISSIGIVSNINDPEKLGRIKVSLPTYEDVETDWLEVLTTGAGINKGLLVLPDIGDRVLLLFINGDPSQAIVLGGLYFGKERPKSGEGKNRFFTLQTKEGQIFQLDDRHNQVLLKNRSGSYLKMSPNQVTIFAKNADLEIKAPGKEITILGKSIDFESG